MPSIIGTSFDFSVHGIDLADLHKRAQDMILSLTHSGYRYDLTDVEPEVMAADGTVRLWKARCGGVVLAQSTSTPSGARR